MEYITLLNNTCQYDKALSCLGSHRFHPWEGGEGKVSTQYRYALTQKAIQLLDEKKYDEAIQLLEQTKVYPENLAKESFQTCRIILPTIIWGLVYEAKGESDTARECFLRASVGLDEPGSVLYYNDQPSDTILYQGLANEKAWQYRCGTQMLPSADLLWRETCIRPGRLRLLLPYPFRRSKCSQAISRIGTTLTVIIS